MGKRNFYKLGHNFDFRLKKNEYKVFPYRIFYDKNDIPQKRFFTWKIKETFHSFDCILKFINESSPTEHKSDDVTSCRLGFFRVRHFYET